MASQTEAVKAWLAHRKQANAAIKAAPKKRNGQRRTIHLARHKRGGNPIEVIPPTDEVEIEPVCIVLTLHGWGIPASAAVKAMVSIALQLPKGSHVVVVQNDPTVHKYMAQLKSKMVRVVTTKNRGFAAACNSGWKVARAKCRWVLFTQMDAGFSASAVRVAIVTAKSANTRRPPVVGPSGGVIELPASGGLWIAERGRQVSSQQHIQTVDFVTGYWLLVGIDEIRDVGGWDDRYFLYWEDPDLCFRLALKGVSSIVNPAIEVNHSRSATIGTVLGDACKLDIQADSRTLFMEAWNIRRSQIQAEE